MKMCVKCGERPVDPRPERSVWCVECRRAYGRANYLLHREEFISRAHDRDKKLDELINGHKRRPCADCDIQYPPYVMDFDHLGDDKEFNIAFMRRHRMAFSKIELEISKCEVVCSNCHRERTNSRQPARYS